MRRTADPVGHTQEEVGNDHVQTEWMDHLPADARRRNQLGVPLLFSSKPAAFGSLVAQPANGPAESEAGVENGVAGLTFTQPLQRCDNSTYNPYVPRISFFTSLKFDATQRRACVSATARGAC